MSPKEISKKVKAVIVKQTWIKEENVRPPADFATDLHIDSVGIYEILTALEGAFSITIEQDAEKFNKVQDMIDIVVELYQSKPICCV